MISKKGKCESSALKSQRHKWTSNGGNSVAVHVKKAQGLSLTINLMCDDNVVTRQPNSPCGILFLLLFSGSHSCLTVCNPMDCSPPGSSAHAIPQASILEWVAISFFRGSS